MRPNTINQLLRICAAIYIFTLICSYLPLVIKISKLSALDRSISRAFDPAIHCRNNTLVIDPSAYDRITKNIGSFDRAVNSACAVELRLLSNDLELIRRSTDETDYLASLPVALADKSSIGHEMVMSSVARALTMGNVKSFRFSEFATSEVREVEQLERLVRLVTANQSCERTIQLEELFVSVEVPDDDFQSPHCPFRTIDLICLIGPRLHSVELDVQSFIPRTEEGVAMVMDLLKSLPPTLTSLKLESNLCPIDDQSVPQQLLGNVKWLPHIRNFDIGMMMESNTELLTIMNSTGTQRPYESLVLSLNNNILALHPFSHLQSLMVGLYDGLNQTMAHFARLDSSSMPKLKSFSFQLFDAEAECNVNPLIMFLSLRPLEELDFDVDQWIKDNVPLSDESIIALRNMSKLQSLKLHMLSRCISSDAIVRLITPACWPVMKILHLGGMALSPDAQDALFLAAPALEALEMSPLFTMNEMELTPKFGPSSVANSRHFPVLSLFLAQTCRLIKQVVLEPEWPGEPQEFDQALLYQCLNTPFHMEHLTDLHLLWFNLPDQMLHMLISKLVGSPVRKFGPVHGSRFHKVIVRGVDGIYVKALHLVMLRKLSHLVEVWVGHDGMKSPLLSGMSRKLEIGSSFPFEDIGDDIVEFRTVEVDGQPVVKISLTVCINRFQSRRRKI